jgi:two-component system, NarL family, response regulator YdfI
VIRVFIVASSSVSRAGLRSMLAEADFAVAGVAQDVELLDEMLLASVPDVILVETTGGASENGLNRLPLREVVHDVPVVLVAGQLDQAQLAEALRAGVRAVLPREISAEQLRAALRAVVAGLIVAHPAEVGALLPAPASTMNDVPPLAEPLTKREREVLQMLASGLANKEVAARLAISDHTAKFHVASILGKLGASTRTEAVAIGIRRGLVLL